MGWDLLVALELHPELALPPGDRPQVRRIGEHLGHRHLGLDLGHARADRLHPQWTTAARVQVADHVSDRVFGRTDREQHDRLEQHGPPVCFLWRPWPLADLLMVSW